MLSGRGFNVNLSVGANAAGNANNPNNNNKTELDARTRLSRRVEQEANENRLRNSVKVMLANAESERMPFEASVEALAVKFPRQLDENKFEVEKAFNIAPFSDHLVLKTVRNMSKSAATSIDGWTRNLLYTAMQKDRSISLDLGVIMSWLVQSRAPANQQSHVFFNELAMDIARSARLIGIPKPEGGVRPIVISSFFAKLAGTLVLKRAKVNSLPYQYAIGKQDGAKQIIHLTREDYNKGMCIIRIDLQNAYNDTKRKRILNLLEADHQSSDLIAYFNTMYQPTSRLVVYGEHGKFKIVDAEEGVRQGDSPSSFYFCYVVSKVGLELAQWCKDNDIEVYIRGFMDDQTIDTDPKHAVRVANKACELYNEYGFKVNAEKSSMICRQQITTDQDSAPPFKVTAASEEFKMLGGIINEQYENLNATIITRITKFFKSLGELLVHPEIIHTILHLCGKPKLLYLAETTPPQFSATIIAEFQKQAKFCFAKLINFQSSRISDERLYCIDGAGMPDYATHAQSLYENARTKALANVVTSKRVRLTTVSTLARLSTDSAAANGSADQGSTDLFTSREAMYDASWSHYLHRAEHDQLSATLYTTALAIRCDVIPDHVHNHLEGRCEAVRCRCDVLCADDKQIIDHSLRCDQMSHIHVGVRHTMLKCALACVARRYGITAVLEPTCYVYQNEIQQRPDILFYTAHTRTVTDVSIMSPKPIPGAAAAAKASEKVKIHSAATKHLNHQFIPFVMETSGHFDSACFELFNKLAENVPFHERIAFKRDLHGAASCAIAEFRASAVINGCHGGNISHLF